MALQSSNSELECCEQIEDSNLMESEQDKSVDCNYLTSESEDLDSSDTESEVEVSKDSLSKCVAICKRLKSSIKERCHAPSVKTQRRPTRKPDPNTRNRNALNARENRKKQKIYVEQLENENANYAKSVKELTKIIKRQSKFIRQLEKENNNYKNSFLNKNNLDSISNPINNRPDICCTTIQLNGNDLTPQTSPQHSTSSEYQQSDFSSSEGDLINAGSSALANFSCENIDSYDFNDESMSQIEWINFLTNSNDPLLSNNVINSNQLKER